MDQQTPDHKCKKQDRAPFSREPGAHARRKSASSKPASSSGSARTVPEKQVTPVQLARSREAETCITTLDYASSSSALPPLPTPALAPPLPPSLAMTPLQEYTDDDIRGDICQFIKEEIDPGGHEAAEAFEKADQQPPITPDSLAELDMPRIINNPKLRHDVNFDRELHFRPNLDGSKGRQKQQQADQYWMALEAEFRILNLALIRKAQSPENDSYWRCIGKAALMRLPKIFAAIRDILKTLVPDYDQKAVKERLDVEHIMQQIRNGVCDLIDLANWLSRILKNHCAPMRDSLVDSMRDEITQGAEQNDPERLVRGLRQLMTILEAMKLDVANHQIRHMRPLLIDDTVNFQRRYNAHRIAMKKLSLEDSQNWITDNLQPMGCEPTHVLALTRGLIHDLVHNEAASFCPPAFYLDADRLRGLRNELHNRVYHAICRDVLREIASPELRESEVLRSCDTLTISVAAIVGAQGKFADKTENIAAEVVRVLLDAEGRYPPIDADLVSSVERRLGDRLRQECRQFREHAISLVDRLVPKVQFSVREHAKLSAIGLQDVLVPQISAQKTTSLGFGAHCEPVTIAATASFPGDPDADLIRRFTHILALHWQVWSELVYLAQTSDKEDDSYSDNDSESTIVQSRTASPSAPIATAVFARGRKWPPVSVTVTDVATLPTPSPSPKPEEGSSSNNGEPNEESLESNQRQTA